GEYRRRITGVQHAEIEEREQATVYGADQVHLPPTNEVGDVAEDWDREERNARGHQHRGEDEIPRHVQRADAIGEDEGGEYVERRLLAHTQQRGETDLLRLLLDDLDNRCVLDLVLSKELLEHRCLEDAKPDPQPDPDQGNAQ